ncbi:MAG: inositol monophosphatase family protein [Cucumibacter sp.]
MKKNGEFTVNIGLVEKQRAVAGVILAPAREKIWGGAAGGAWMAEVHGIGAYERRSIAVQTSRSPKVVASRSHGHAALQSLMDAFGATENLSVGSALKFGLLAEGTAQLYPRLTPTAEWDTAAGQAILEAAGGAMLSIDGEPMRYGKRLESFINPMFVAASDLALARACAARMRALV